MAEENKLLQLFVTTRSSRSAEVAADAVNAEMKAMLEEDWARQNGLDLAKVRQSQTGTESTCSHQLPSSPSFSPTTTQQGMDVTTDNTTDPGQTVTVVDGIKNDDPTTGGIIDIPL